MGNLLQKTDIDLDKCVHSVPSCYLIYYRELLGIETHTILLCSDILHAELIFSNSSGSLEWIM